MPYLSVFSLIMSVFILVLCMLLCTGQAQDAVLTIEPNSFSFFIGESVTFICDMNEGEDTDWYYKITKDGQKFTPYSTHKDSTLQMTYTGDGGEYQCSGSWKRAYYTKNSNTVSITVLADQPKAQITSDMRDIPVGGSVTLTCSVNPSSWMLSPRQMAESVSHRKDSTGAEEEEETQVTTQRTGNKFTLTQLFKGPANDQTLNQDEDQQQVYSSLLHGDRCVYETVRRCENTENGPAEGDYTNVTSVIQLKVINKTSECTKWQRGDPEESSDYNNVNPNSATALKS
ncbi:uncharacterized protein LOC102078616 [Oreochromis niloticus]|uniref:uncharacterized protein LOC102078616 n=1 Tax=Oreochromis niloticus TaxID=8128 RepID=UPI000DF1DC49|nr:uncharacterized protein LOC102078616 [Oreochromis niloticus]CAI5686292.1 unnamed protein product [Mustela putorius furo]